MKRRLQPMASRPIARQHAGMDALIVDDSRVARAMLQGVLREALAGVQVDAVGDLESAFHRADPDRGKRPDLVLLDLGLPGCEGFEALARFHGKFPRVRVVVISATDDRGSIGEALEAGAIAYISKSSSRDAMIGALRQVAAGGVHVSSELETVAEPD